VQLISLHYPPSSNNIYHGCTFCRTTKARYVFQVLWSEDVKTSDVDDKLHFTRSLAVDARGNFRNCCQGFFDPQFSAFLIFHIRATSTVHFNNF
jgi:hypothetical protein